MEILWSHLPHPFWDQMVTAEHKINWSGNNWEDTSFYGGNYSKFEEYNPNVCNWTTHQIENYSSYWLIRVQVQYADFRCWNRFPLFCGCIAYAFSFNYLITIYGIFIFELLWGDFNLKFFFITNKNKGSFI